MHSILCLGDSYTIGESVALHENFPYQLVQILRAEGFKFSAPEIIAKTGWTTFELRDHLLHTITNKNYDFVTLLIGVNNQYRGLSIEEYRTDFELLLGKALKLTKKPRQVIVLSIPDWGATPFAEGRERNKITEEINNYNAINKEIASNYKTTYIDITESTREVITDESLVTTDKLHYSVKEHRRWAEKIADEIKKQL